MLLFIDGTVVIDTEIDTFQNISCYCLSADSKLHTLMNANFKTSHVIVYLDEAVKKLNDLKNFKTSHVIVYRR